MSNNIDDKLIKGHEYDGIQELDNPLPGWWLATFYGTIIFAAIYYVYYTFMGGLSLADELKVAMTEVKAVQSATAANVKMPTEDELAAKFTPEVVAQGKAVFAERCAACHTATGGGLIGPNLTDNYWIHGAGKRADIYAVVYGGAPNTAMIAWSAVLKPAEITAAAAFVYSLKNTMIAGGLPPQGNKVNEDGTIEVAKPADAAAAAPAGAAPAATPAAPAPTEKK
jgi:cytochrome c oxidase cbb3-type subunit 3